MTSSGSKRLIEKRDISGLHVLLLPRHVMMVLLVHVVGGWWIDGGWIVAAVLVKIMRHWLDSIDGRYKKNCM